MRLKNISTHFLASTVLRLIVCFVLDSGVVPVYAIDLTRVDKLVKTKSIEIKRLKEKVRSAHISISEKRWGFGPTFEISVYHLQTDQAKPIDIGKTASDYQISLSQPLYRAGLWHDHSEAVLNARAVEVQLRELNESLTLKTLLAVLDICRIRSRLVITGDSRMLVSQAVNVQKQLLQSGYGSRFDLVEAEVELARYQKEYRELANQLDLKLFELGNISGGKWDMKDFPLIMDPELRPMQDLTSYNVSHWIESAYRENSQLQLIQINRELSWISKARVYNSLKPRVNLILSHHQAEEDAFTRNRVDESSVKLSMSMSFSPVSTYYQGQRYDIEENVLKIEAEKVKKDLTHSIHELLRSIALTAENVNAQRHWKTKQKMIVEMYRKGLKQKHFPFSRFLDNSRKYNESQHDLAQAFIDIWEDRIRLLHLSGQLKAEPLIQLARDFDRISVSTR